MNQYISPVILYHKTMYIYFTNTADAAMSVFISNTNNIGC